MSCTGQSAATQSIVTASANHPFCRRVTNGDPSRTAFGPITRTAYTPKPMTAAISSHTSGCGWDRHGSTGAGTNAVMSSGEDVERRQNDEIAAGREHDARDEDLAEELAVEAQVHEERGDGRELHDHQHGQEAGQHEEVEALDVVQPDLGAGHD